MSEATKRADYGRQELPREGAWISQVRPGSPAEAAGLEPGMRIAAVNDVVPRDVIDWLWEADGAWTTVDVEVPGEEGLFSCELEREPGQDWGISFADPLFDGIHVCRNRCTFCFMAMLPPHMRSTMYLRDDDYRLSFLQGNFVTLTNVEDDEVERIIAHRMEPMNVSIQAVSPDVRERLLGRNAWRGMEVLERLCAAGLEIHGQVVVCPGDNDGEELRRTLDWVEARPNITSVALVPLGYTRWSKHYHESFSDHPEWARAVIELIAPYQRRARESLGITRFQLSDEFYLDAHVEVPPAETYDGYPQFYDGIGMVRSFIDECAELGRERAADAERVRAWLDARGERLLLATGGAALSCMRAFVDELGLADVASIQQVRCDFWGGNVDVTGLICGRDLREQLPVDLVGTHVVLADVMFNEAGNMLDDVSQAEVAALVAERGGELLVTACGASDLLDALVALTR